MNKNPHSRPPVFLRHSHEDVGLAKKIAEQFVSSGIKIWLDKSEMKAGDSLRRKTEEGIDGCTHFCVLLTPSSIKSDWVAQELDEGFVKHIEGKCQLIPIRSNLKVEAMPIFLRNKYAPSIDPQDPRAAVEELISAIRGMTKPPLGTLPEAIALAQDIESAYSPTALVIAKYFVTRSKLGIKFDPDICIDELAKELKLPIDEVLCAVEDLESEEFLYRFGHIAPDNNENLTAEESLFVEFDYRWMNWSAEEDAKSVATWMVNHNNSSPSPTEISKALDLPARRVNPALCWLEQEALVDLYRAIGTRPFCCFEVKGYQHRIKRLLRSQVG